MPPRSVRPAPARVNSHSAELLYWELRQGERSLARIAVWCAVVLLVALGVAAAIARALFVDDLAARLEPSRRSILRSLAISDPLPLQRDEELARFDASYAAHRRMTLLHVLPGALF